MRTGSLGWARAGVGVLALWAAAAAVDPAPTAACVGGTAFDWAVAHQHGGLVRAVVIEAHDRADFTIDLAVSATEVLRGDPPADTQVHVAVGLVCDQHPDVGETVILVFDVRGGVPPFAFPLVYVIAGIDALDPAAVSAAMSALPATDAAIDASRRSNDNPPMAAAIAALAGVLAFVLALGRPRSSYRSGSPIQRSGSSDIGNHRFGKFQGP